MPKIITTGNPILDSSLDFSKQWEGSNGVVCIYHIDESQYAARKGLKNTFVFLAFDPNSNGYCEYVIAVGNQPVFSSQTIEGIASYLDVMKMAQGYLIR